MDKDWAINLGSLRNQGLGFRISFTPLAGTLLVGEDHNMDRTCRVKQFGIHGVYLVTVLILLVMVLDSVSAQTAGGVDGLCPNTVR